MSSGNHNFKLLTIAIGTSNLKLVFCACLFLASCAIRQQPGGGAKDLLPPKIEKSIPENYSISFTAKEIRIDFDEYIDLKELNKQLVISPLMKSDPEISVKGKSLLIKLPDSLRQNTTYTLNFGSAIVDTHEGNIFENFQYVFATGLVLDSLEVNGTVKFAENLKTEKGIVVMLYNNTNDSVVYNTLPDYFAKTDSAGIFTIRNLRSGTYKLFALKDANGNYKFDSKTESIGFATELINVPDTTSLAIKMFVEPDTIPHVLKAQFASPGKIKIVFTTPVKKFNLKMIDEQATSFQKLLFEYGVTGDTVNVYSTDTLTDSLNAVIFNGSTLVDTVHVNFKPLSTSRGKGDLFSSTLDISANLNGDVLEMPAALVIDFSTPIKSFDVNQLKLFKDSTTEVNCSTSPIDSLKKSYGVNFKAEENKSYRLLIPLKAATDIFNHHNDSVLIKFRTREEKEYASVVLNLSASTSKFNYIVQLLTENDAVVKELTIYKSQKITFEHILPGKYKIRIADDANKNGKWDSGNYWRKTQPENVFYYPELVTTRANWDVDLNWILKQ